MIKVIIGVIIIVFLLTFAMFYLLKGIVKNVNEKAKSYFVLKMQDYDDEVSNQQLLKKEEIAEKNNDQKEEKNILDKEEYNINDDVADYQVENFFEKYKEIEEKFNINSEKVINNFINKNCNKLNLDYYKCLVSLKNKLNDKMIFELFNNDSNEILSKLNKIFDKYENNVLKQYLLFINKFQLDEFINYIDNELNSNDPIIYIEVGNKKENYNYLNKFVKTIYNNSIYKGFKIIYRNKIYDYSLN